MWCVKKKEGLKLNKKNGEERLGKIFFVFTRMKLSRTEWTHSSEKKKKFSYTRSSMLFSQNRINFKFPFSMTRHECFITHALWVTRTSIQKLFIINLVPKSKLQSFLHILWGLATFELGLAAIAIKAKDFFLSK